ncbi:Prefoldin subunit 4 [Balamuthia mandrillaris]
MAKVQEGGEDVNVTWEDQQAINSFGRLNIRFHEIEDEVKKLKEEAQNLDDSTNELILADDDVPVRYKAGEVFVEVPKEEAEQMLEKALQENGVQMEKLEEELAAIKKTMAELKVRLYGKFGSNINLDE